MHYPVRIQHYPDTNNMVTDGQWLGVLTGQFIRAQRTCSTIRQFKARVRKIALAALQRGYGTREMDRVWGKFLVRWWTARELRRGELRAWFHRMLWNSKRTGEGPVRSLRSKGAGMGGRAFAKQRARSGTQTKVAT